MDGRVERILEKLGRAAGDPTLLELFGASAHGYRLNPPPAEDEVLAFEARHRVRLPEEYRLFLLEAGDGGAGPAYGALRLDAAEDHLPDDSLAVDSHLAPGIEYTASWADGLAEPYRGLLTVVDRGCTSSSFLVVTGAGRGRIVAEDPSSGRPPQLAEDADFLAWYERWLDEVLAGHSSPGSDFRVLGDEAALLGVLATEPAPTRRVRAVRSLRRLPDRSPVSDRALVDAATADPDPRVRSEVFGCVWRENATSPYTGLPEPVGPDDPIRVAGIEDAARAALDDDEAPAVYADALHILRVFRTPDLAVRARVLLTDPDDDVVRTAGWALADSGDCRIADLTPLLDRPSASSRASAVFHAVGARDDASPFLRRALADPEARVRRQAVQTAAERDERGLEPLLRQLLSTEPDASVRGNLERVTAEWSR